jgi:hypothetical protein
MILSILGILIILFFFLPGPKKQDVTAKPEQTAVIPHIEEATRKEEGKGPAYTVDIQYPKLVGTADTGIADKVNKDIANELDKAVADLKQNRSEPPAVIADVKNDLTIRYEVDYLNPSIFSMALSQSEYIAGAAHPQNLILTMTYDLRTGERAGLADLFTKGSDYLKTLSDYSIPALTKQLDIKPDDADGKSTIVAGAAPTADNYQEFLIAKEGFIVVFNTYQVGPYVIGAPRVAVPYALFAKITDPNGILPLRGN